MVHSAIQGKAVSILTTLLNVMFSYSLSQDTATENWELEHITPIFKGGQSNGSLSYWPIALLLIPLKSP